MNVNERICTSESMVMLIHVQASRIAELACSIHLESPEGERKVKVVHQ